MDKIHPDCSDTHCAHVLSVPSTSYKELLVPTLRVQYLDPLVRYYTTTSTGAGLLARLGLRHLGQHGAFGVLQASAAECCDLFVRHVQDPITGVHSLVCRCCRCMQICIYR